MKIVINRGFGGYELSRKAYDFLGLTWDDYGYAYHNDRANPKLVECVETLGTEMASGCFAELKVVEIPDGVEWCIDDYDGIEAVHEMHRVWA